MQPSSYSHPSTSSSPSTTTRSSPPGSGRRGQSHLEGCSVDWLHDGGRSANHPTRGHPTRCAAGAVPIVAVTPHVAARQLVLVRQEGEQDAAFLQAALHQALSLALADLKVRRCARGAMRNFAGLELRQDGCWDCARAVLHDLPWSKPQGARPLARQLPKHFQGLLAAPPDAARRWGRGSPARAFAHPGHWRRGRLERSSVLLRGCICLARARPVDHVEGHLNLKEVTGSTFQPRRVQDVADGRVELREHSKHVRSRHT